MSEFTKGEWKIINDDIIFGRCVGGCQLKEDTFMIAEVRGWGHLQYLGEDKAFNIQKANARLIATAPKLYDACRDFDQSFSKEGQIDISKINKARIKAQAALAKVEEKQ